MITDTICAFQAEIGDQILFPTGEVCVIVEKDDIVDEYGDSIALFFKNEDGEGSSDGFDPFDTLTIITKFDEDIEIEDVE